MKELLSLPTIQEDINRLKESRHAVILVHNYQIEEVQLIGDFIGDSLELSKLAAETEAEVIVFAGVKFMAETAKILSPEKTILLPRLDAGCPMADMITVEELIELKQEHPDATVVTYVNSSVEIKAESDVCCTSANAVKLVKNLNADKIIFVPDRNLANYVQSKVPEKKIITYEGYCYVHNRIKREEILVTKEKFPEARVIVHPEVRPEIIELADEVLSTSQMLRYASQSPDRIFIVGTEQGLLERMKRENPEKEFLPAFKPKICSNMKKTALTDVHRALNENIYEIYIEPNIIKKAAKSLKEMIKYV